MLVNLHTMQKIPSLLHHETLSNFTDRKFKSLHIFIKYL